MKLDEILQSAGKNKPRKRLGRGDGSGHGKTSGRGHKGYGSRSGAKRRLGYEGGQTPMIARVPKRGFNNKNFRTEYQPVNVGDLEECFDDGQRVDIADLLQKGLIGEIAQPVKILGDGEIRKKLTVAANAFSSSAREKITQAGGTVEEL